MREIDLPITIVHSSEAVKVKEWINSEKILRIDLGANNSILEIVRRNGGKLLYATSSLELEIDETIKFIFFSSNDENEIIQFFDQIILKSSDFNFGFKKKILINCINKFGLLKSKDKNDFENSLSDILKWRNAFAHGNLEFDNTKGVLLHYFSGSKNRLEVLEVNDEFWNKVEGTFKTIKNLIKKIPHIKKTKV